MLGAALIRAGVLGALVVLAGCGGPQSTVPQTTVAQYRAHKLPGSNRDLLYVSDGVHDVRVFSLPQGDLVQTLTSVSRPELQCSDRKGNVYIADWDGGKLDEFAHGGSSPINVLYLNRYVLPGRCTVDETTGSVALTAFHDGYGELDIFSGGQGSPSVHTIPGFAGYISCAYDDDGNLYVDGEDASGNFLLAEMLKGTSDFRNISQDLKIKNPSSMQWDGQYLAVTGTANEVTDLLYQFKVKGSSAKIVHTVLLERSLWLQTWIQGASVAAVYCDRPHSARCKAIGIWQYPAGGKPTNTISRSDFSSKNGIRGLTISVAPSHK